jgi:hypothetical protein
LPRGIFTPPTDLQNLPQHMIEEANQWYIASRRCQAPMDFSPNVSQTLLYPAIVCNAFSVEMYVKSLLVVSKITYEYGHGFDKLFSR